VWRSVLRGSPLGKELTPFPRRRRFFVLAAASSVAFTLAITMIGALLIRWLHGSLVPHALHEREQHEGSFMVLDWLLLYGADLLVIASLAISVLVTRAVGSGDRASGRA